MEFTNNSLNSTNSTNHTTTAAANNGEPWHEDVVLGILGGLAVLTNAPLLFVIFKNKKLMAPIFLARMSLLVGNLAFADCLTGVVLMISISPYSKYDVALSWTTVEASFFTLLLVSMERFVVLTHPLSWPFILSKCRIYCSIAVVWILSITCGIMVHEYGRKAQFALTVLFEIQVITVVVLHSIILFYLQNRHQKFCEHLDKFNANNRQLSNSTTVGQRNATRLTLILVIILIVTVLPYIIVLQILCGHFEYGFFPENVAATLLETWIYFYWLELVNFIVNPIVYAWSIKRYRSALKETFSRGSFQRQKKEFNRRLLYAK